MRVLFICFFLILSSMVFASRQLNPRYFKQNEKIYFGYYLNNSKEIKDCDFSSFKELRHHDYAIDKNSVYYLGDKLLLADPTTFQVLGEGYSKDKDHVFYKKKHIKNADASNFKPVISLMHDTKFIGYGKDMKNVFHRGNETPYDPLTFKVLGEGYILDKKGIYFDQQIISDSDPEKYIHENFYLITNNTVYFLGAPLSNVDATSFKILSMDLGIEPPAGIRANLTYVIITKDKNNVFLNNEPINVDTDSFVKKGKHNFEDKNTKYKVKITPNKKVLSQSLQLPKFPQTPILMAAELVPID